MTLREMPPDLLQRSALVYVRQSSDGQIRDNHESQRRQYGLADLAQSCGFRDVRVIDDDLGVSANGTMDRPGFRDLVAQICQGSVGAVFCLEASRLARNGRDWHQLIELCGFMGTRLVDGDKVYDPANPDDRLVLGLKGTMCEFELTLLRRRMREAVISKAQRGELRRLVPVGYVWSHDTGLSVDPDRRVQEAIRSIFRLFERSGSARQTVLCLHRDRLSFPRSSDGRTRQHTTWGPPAYGHVLKALHNPFYAGAYVHGRTHAEKCVADGHIRKARVRTRPMSEWEIVIPNHHEGYISWEQFEQNQRRLARNAYGKAAGPAKSGRGGGALLSSLLRCRRCAQMLTVQYRGGNGKHRYLCRAGWMTHGAQSCVSFPGKTADQAVGAEILVAVQPLAVEAALMAEREVVAQHDQRRRALELELEQAAYEVKLATRRYEAVDPDNRLVAAELEMRWNTALARLRECEARMTADQDPQPVLPDREGLLTLAMDLKVVWDAPTTDMRTKQRLVRSLIEEIVVDVDQATREIVFVIHWRGGQHSELRARIGRPGRVEARCTSEEADRLIREMAPKWSDAAIAATLNRMRMKTGLGKSWTRQLVANHRHGHHIANQPRDGRCLTMAEAASQLGVTPHVVRALITSGTLPAKQVTPDAPWHIEARDLELPALRQALQGSGRQRGRPRRYSRDDRTLVIPGTCKDGAQ
jgi:DNA invertase Pin-like site-specific DNA recombinase